MHICLERGRNQKLTLRVASANVWANYPQEVKKVEDVPKVAETTVKRPVSYLF